VHSTLRDTTTLYTNRCQTLNTLLIRQLKSMRGTLKVILSIGFLLAILNITFYYGFFPFVEHCAGSHNGKEEFLLILTILIPIIFFIKGGIGLYKKKNPILSISLILIGINLLIWFNIFNNVECINCSLV